MKSMVGQLNDSSRDVECLRTWDSRELQRLVCWCAVGLAMDVAKDGMTTGGYGAEYARKSRPVGHGSVGDEVVTSNA